MTCMQIKSRAIQLDINPATSQPQPLIHTPLKHTTSQAPARRTPGRPSGRSPRTTSSSATRKTCWRRSRGRRPSGGSRSWGSKYGCVCGRRAVSTPPAPFVHVHSTASHPLHTTTTTSALAGTSGSSGRSLGWRSGRATRRWRRRTGSATTGACWMRYVLCMHRGRMSIWPLTLSNINPTYV